jgi:hypothetical protein
MHFVVGFIFAHTFAHMRPCFEKPASTTPAWREIKAEFVKIPPGGFPDPTVTMARAYRHRCTPSRNVIVAADPATGIMELKCPPVVTTCNVDCLMYVDTLGRDCLPDVWLTVTINGVSAGNFCCAAPKTNRIPLSITMGPDVRIAVTGTLHDEHGNAIDTGTPAKFGLDIGLQTIMDDSFTESRMRGAAALGLDPGMHGKLAGLYDTYTRNLPGPDVSIVAIYVWDKAGTAAGVGAGVLFTDVPSMPKRHCVPLIFMKKRRGNVYKLTVGLGGRSACVGCGLLLQGGRVDIVGLPAAVLVYRVQHALVMK